MRFPFLLTFGCCLAAFLLVLFHGRIFSLQAPPAEYEFVKLDDYRGARGKKESKLQQIIFDSD